MSKKKKEVITSLVLGQRIFSDYSHWVEIFNEGCNDPNWSDGVNINLVRNHILYDKSEVERVLGDNYIAYPDEYFYPDPVELSSNFMAKERRALFDPKATTIKENRGGFHSLSQCLLFDWKEALC